MKTGPGHTGQLTLLGWPPTHGGWQSWWWMMPQVLTCGEIILGGTLLRGKWNWTPITWITHPYISFPSFLVYFSPLLPFFFLESPFLQVFNSGLSLKKYSNYDGNFFQNVYVSYQLFLLLLPLLLLFVLLLLHSVSFSKWIDIKMARLEDLSKYYGLILKCLLCKMLGLFVCACVS